MGFFDFITELDHYKGNEGALSRLNKRHPFIIDDFKEEIVGASVLDLASHDGRWCYAFAGAGANSVEGIELRPELVEMFEKYPERDFKDRVNLRQGEMFAELEKLVASGAQYDVIGVLGIFYHIMDHHRLIVLLKALKPKLIIIDSMFVNHGAAIIRFSNERVDRQHNSGAYFEGQERALVGIPSVAAMDSIARTLNFDIHWSDWSRVPKGERQSVSDYFGQGDTQRGTCALRPQD